MVNQIECEEFNFFPKVHTIFERDKRHSYRNRNTRSISPQTVINYRPQSQISVAEIKTILPKL